MHPVLQTPELLNAILYEVALDNHTKFSTCRAMALTCKLFLDPAMDILWARFYALNYFIRCFPSDVWSESVTGRGPVVSLRRAPRINEWDRFLWYSRRLRTLEICPHDTPPLQLEQLRVNLPPGAVLFPSLRDLAMDTVHTTSMPDPVSLIGPALNSLTISGVSPDHDSILFFLSRLRQVAPYLQELELQSGLAQDDQPVLDGDLPEFPRLQVFAATGFARASHVTPAAWQRLAALENLSTLTAHCPQWTAPLSTPHSFPALTYLDLYSTFQSTPICSLTMFLRSITSKHLRSLTYWLRSPTQASFLTRANVIQQLFEALAAHSSLEELRIYDSDVNRVGDEQPPSLSPLLRLRHLRKLVLRAKGLQLTEALIEGFGTHCKDLSTLDVKSLDPAPPPVLTLHALELVAVHLPLLECFAASLSISEENIPAPSKVRSRGSILLDLASSEMPAQSWRSVAAYISGVFPKATVRSNRPGAWQEIRDLMPVLASIREHEDIFAQEGEYVN